MNFLGHGIDIVAMERFAEAIQRQGDPFLERIFTAKEMEYCRAHKDPLPHYAARFAAREAYAKAIGMGLGACGDLQELEVQKNIAGAPFLQLHGRAAEIFQGRGGREIHLSLSHDGGHAVASVILLGDMK